jgi:hypothetical protein
MPDLPDDPPWTARIVAELSAADQRATALASPLTPEQLNWVPGRGEWSIGQCLDHLRGERGLPCGDGDGTAEKPTPGRPSTGD